MNPKTHKVGSYIKDRVGYSVDSTFYGIENRGSFFDAAKVVTIATMCGALVSGSLPVLMGDFQDVNFTHDDVVVSQEYKAEMDSRLDNLVELNETIEQLTRDIEIKTVEDADAVQGLKDALQAAKDQLGTETQLFGTLLYTDSDMTETLAAEYLQTLQDNHFKTTYFDFETTVDPDGLKECQLQQAESTSSLQSQADSIESCMKDSGKTAEQLESAYKTGFALGGGALGLVFGLFGVAGIHDGRRRSQPTKPRYADYKRIKRDN